MARESKQKRDERRFGKSDRLVDIIDFGKSSPVIVDGTNIHDYYIGFAKERGLIDVVKDIHCVALPFSPIFIEMYCVNIFMRVGWIFSSIDPEGRLATEAAPVEGITSWENAFSGVLYFKSGNNIGNAVAQCVCYLDKFGRLVANPCIRIHESFAPIAAAITEDGRHFIMETLVPILMTLAFMHCKSVVLESHDPDPVVNRERKKHNKQPFVRYNTINIEPMKKILRVEGNIDIVGLKKALHNVRGHFVTYTDEAPLFGRLVGTFWKPAHTRGSLDQGVVISDYDVKPPKP